ncbi:DUF6274 family protein [Streptomyces sp. NPDC050255]|uniref:DUF6274 family protein n=1 Tax=Streptomyces sp. NPDC050255 TaxID=3365606 RepID=UPI00379E9968
MAASTSENFLPDRSGAREPVPAQPPGTAPAPVRRRTPRHEIRALLRAHLAAASGYRHLTRHCAVCARLLRLAMEPLTATEATETASVALADPGRPEPPQAALTSLDPREPAQAALPCPGASGTASVGLTSPGPPGTTPVAMAVPEAPRAPGSVPVPEAPRAPEQTGVHVMPSDAPEQTAQPVTGAGAGRAAATRPGPTPAPATAPGPAHSAAPDTGPHALARRPASARMTTRLALARASASPGGAEVGPDGGDPGPDGRRGPGWAGDESPPAA